MAFAALDYYYAKKPIPSMTSTPPNVHPLAKHIKERLYDSLGLKLDPSQIYHYGCGASVGEVIILIIHHYHYHHRHHLQLHHHQILRIHCY